MKIHQDPKRCQDILWHQQCFLMNINSSPTARNFHMCPCSTFLNKQWFQKATGNQTMLGFEPLTRCCYSNSESKKDVVPSLPHVPKLGTSICFPYPARQVSNSWRTQDGFFLHERKVKSRDVFYRISNKFLSKLAF